MWLGNRHLLRGVVVWLAATLATLVGGIAARPGLTGLVDGRPVRLDGALVEGASCLLLCCLVRLWLVTTLVVAQVVVRGARPSLATGLRRWLLVACGVAVAATTCPPAGADCGPHRPAAAVLPYPDRAVAPARPGIRSASPRTVVVRPGDSLWAITRRDLGPGASDGEVTLGWHRLYAANRSRIGTDPDLVEPGLRLLLPGRTRHD